jgi:hypothetical protein
MLYIIQALQPDHRFRIGRPIASLDAFLYAEFSNSGLIAWGSTSIGKEKAS